MTKNSNNNVESILTSTTNTNDVTIDKVPFQTTKYADVPDTYDS